jgi:hypothetical protein
VNKQTLLVLDSVKVYSVEITEREREMANEFVSTTVEVPIARHGEFHEMFGRWLGGPIEQDEPTGWRNGRPWTPHDRVDAHNFYERVSSTARKVLDFWASHPGEWVSGEETAAAVGVNGPKGVAGTLSSVGTTANKLRKQLPFEHRDGPSGASGSYRMTPSIAALFVAVRTDIEG